MDMQSSITTLGSAAKELLERDYWTRLWIIQEILLGNDNLLLCGTDCIEGYTFFNQWIAPAIRPDKFIPSNSPLNRIDFSSIFAAPGSGILSQRYGDLIHIFDSLYDLFNLFHNRRCVNPHDKIYGLIGIIHPDEAGTAIKVDYAKSPEELCCEVLTAVWEDLRRDPPSRTGSFLRILMLALQLPGPDPQESYELDSDRMPAWAPEWVTNHIGNLAKERPRTFTGLALELLAMTQLSGHTFLWLAR